MRLFALPVLAGAMLLSGCYVNLSTPLPALAIKMDADAATKQGTAVCSGFLWVFGSGDCSLTTAMRNGKITKVHHVDASEKLFLMGLTSELKITVYGE
jgi:hypothetical protein